MSGARDERWFRAMGGDCHAVVLGAPAGIVVDTVRRLEARWSRFLPDSEVSRANGAAGHPVRVSTETALLAQRVLEAAALTEGWFDALLGAEVRAAGYDRDLAEVVARHGAVGPSVPRTGPSRRPGTRPPRGLPLVLGVGTLTVPVGRALDPGGIGKGLAADLAVEAAVAAGATGVLVNLGGDVRVRGVDVDGRPLGVVVAGDAVEGAPTGTGWDDGVRDVVLGIVDGAVATSTTRRRRWRDPVHDVAHHLVDPATGLPTVHELHTATVVAGAGWWADAAASALVAAGPAAPALAIGLGLTARLVHDRGEPLELGEWAAFAGAPA